MGSVLPTFKSDHALINNKMYKFTGNKTQGYSQKKHLINNAMVYLNTPYLWGGRTPFGIDCSGFTQIIYRLQGMKIPRDAYQQIEIGQNIDLSNSEAGDLAFFENKSGKIINIGSMMSIFGNANSAAYAASKGGVVQYTKSCAIAWAKYNIQINTILPGWIVTDMTNEFKKVNPKRYATIAGRTPAERWGLPEDMAGTAIFLSSKFSDFVNGVSIPVDGGYSVM